MNFISCIIVLVGVQSSVTEIFSRASYRIDLVFTENLVWRFVQRLVLFENRRTVIGAFCASWKVAGVLERSGVRLLDRGCSKVCTGGAEAGRC